MQKNKQMKRYVFLLLAISRMLTSFGQNADFRIEGVGSTILPVTLNKMTNIIFPGSVRLAVKVSRDVLAQKVRGVDNVIELKAMRRGFAPTNLSVYGVNGRLYSFVLKYVDDTSTLNYRVVFSSSAADIHLAGLPVDETRLQSDAEHLAAEPGFLHNSTRSGRVRFSIKGIWLRDSLQWLVFDLDNRSPVAFRPTRLRFFLQDAEHISRRAAQQVQMKSVYGAATSNLPARKSASFAIAFEPFVIPRGKQLIAQLQSQNGRMLELEISDRMVLRAR